MPNRPPSHRPPRPATPAQAKGPRLYDRQAWRRRSKAARAGEPCAECLKHGIVTPAEHLDHIEAHHGDREAFWNGETQALCHSCHSRKTVAEQQRRKGN